MFRLHLLAEASRMTGLALLAGVAFQFSAHGEGAPADPDSRADATATATDQTSAAALEVQRALGGSVANQFPQLQSAPDGSPWWKQFSGSLDASSPFAPATVTDQAPIWWSPSQDRNVVNAASESPTATRVDPKVAALRRTAAELEVTANRLEEIELYPQADALRELAQRLRADARESLARVRGRQPGEQAGTYGQQSPGHAGEQPASASNQPYPEASAEYGGEVSRESAASSEHADAPGEAHAPDERSVILGPAPE